MRYVADQSGIETGLYAIKGLETVEVTDGCRNARFVMNHNNYPVVVPLDGKHTDVLAEETHETSIKLEPYGVAILVKA